MKRVERLLPPSLRPALISLAFNLPLALAGVHRGAYDTYVHIFFADHYRLNWFEGREFRWYTGFSVNSYPPLVHQLIALLSWPMSAIAAWFAPPAELPSLYRYRGEELGYIVVLLAVLAAFPYAVRGFARIFVGPRAARWAGWLAIFCPAIGLAGWSFGQLPTLAATALFLFALAQGYRYIRYDERPALARAVALAGAAAGAHHAALLFAIFAGAAVVAKAVLSNQILKSLYPSTLRAIAWAGLSALAVVVVLWPFLEWSAGYQPQTPIDHASRHNFIADPIVTFTFFWPAYGAFLLLLPWAAVVGVRLRRLWPLTALTVLFFLLGLGGTTPLPRWLFGPNWEWLTYDRFALWAAICLLPFGGSLLVKFRRLFLSPAPPYPRARSLFIVHCSLLIASALYGSLNSVLKPAQPPVVDLIPVAKFLAEGANDQWRYLTLGFGDQAAKLAALTTAATPDGAYHTARELPALRVSGLAQLDTVVWQPGGANAARPFLATAAEEWAVRWVFVNHYDYDPILRETGWRFVRMFENGVELWQKDRVWPVAPWRLVNSGPTPAAQWWGSAPLAALCLALGLGALNDARLRHAARFGHRLLFYCFVLVLPFGWHHVISINQSSGVFFTYRSVIVFAADLVLLSLLALWLLDWWLSGDPRAQRRHLRWGAVTVGLAWIGLLAAVAFSIPHSIDPTLSTAILLHLALLSGLYLYLQSETPAWAMISALLMIQLGVQSLLGLIEFAAQSTAVIGPLQLPFIGSLTPDIPGASVVQTADGTRWLRAYGSLWHPNVLGAVLLVCLAGVLIKGTEGNRGTKGTGISLSSFISLSSLSFALGLVALALSFSRAAWIGALVAGGVLALRLPRDELRRLWPGAVIGAIALAFTVIALRPLFLTRATADPRSPLERFSVEERASVAEAALHLARLNLWTGVGAGGFVEALAAHPELRVSREPAHDVPLLALTETGIPGALALAALAAAIGYEMIRRRPATPRAAVFTAVLIGLLLTSLFDHFLWSSSPGRLLAALAFSLWAAANGDSDIYSGRDVRGPLAARPGCPIGGRAVLKLWKRFVKPFVPIAMRSALARLVPPRRGPKDPAKPAVTIDNAMRRNRCPACASERIEHLGKLQYLEPAVFADTPITIQRQPELWRCHACQSWFSQNILSEADAVRLYKLKTSRRWTSPEPFEVRRPAEQAALIAKLLRPGMRVLDIGCSAGQFLDFAARQGCATVGVEYSESARSECLAKGHACVASVEELGADTQFSAIFAFDVVEHVYDLGEFLGTYVPFLEAGGLFCALTGDNQSWPARLMKNRWWYVRYPEHVVFPSRKFFDQLDGFTTLHVLATYAMRWQQAGGLKKVYEVAFNSLLGRYAGQPSFVEDHMLIVLRRS